MKSVFAAVCLIASSFVSPAFAQAGEISANVMVCSSSGFALANLSIDEGGKTGGIVYITLSEADDAQTLKYAITSGMKDIQKGTSATVIARSANSKDVSDSMTDSVLIRVLDGQKRAILALNGTVYRLNCVRSAN
ncbi:MAG: hypothetical protein EOP06_01330 [Proteobacteria bacterium]|nr:MAG: hypothetical protein EOP06_01330 [Pseudomonadota bacterium]